MQIVITAVPRFSVALSPEDVELLSRLSASHYDARCRAASVPGVHGFIHGWRVGQTWASEEGDEQVPAAEATWHELDTSLKIMENTRGLPSDDQARARELTRNLSGALEFARALLPVWKAVYGGCT